MLKFKFEKGRTLKAYESVVIFGKTEEGLAKSVEWMCTHLVLSEGQTVTRDVENRMRVTVCKKDEPLWFMVRYSLWNIIARRLILFGKLLS